MKKEMIINKIKELFYNKKKLVEEVAATTLGGKE